MKWNRYTIKTTTEAVDIISCMLAELGIEGIEIQDNVQLTQEEAKTMFVDFIPSMPSSASMQLMRSTASVVVLIVYLFHFIFISNSNQFS